MGVVCSTNKANGLVKNKEKASVDTVIDLTEDTKKKYSNSVAFESTAEENSNSQSNKINKLEFKLMSFENIFDIDKENITKELKSQNILKEKITCLIVLLLFCHGKYYTQAKNLFITQLLPEINLKQQQILKAKSKKQMSEIFNGVFDNMSEEFKKDKDMDFSGVTMNMIIFQTITKIDKANKLPLLERVRKQTYCLNIGDHRSFIFQSFGKGFRKELIQLSYDQNFNRKDEVDRINNIAPISYQVDNKNAKYYYRVYPYKGKYTLSSSLLTRTIGDNQCKIFGNSSKFEITTIENINQDKFIFIGSNTIFQVLSNQEIVKILNDEYKKNKTEISKILISLINIANDRFKIMNVEIKKNGNSFMTESFKYGKNESSFFTKNLSKNEFSRNIEKASHVKSDTKSLDKNYEIMVPELGCCLILI